MRLKPSSARGGHGTGSDGADGLHGPACHAVWRINRVYLSKLLIDLLWSQDILRLKCGRLQRFCLDEGSPKRYGDIDSGPSLRLGRGRCSAEAGFQFSVSPLESGDLGPVASAATLRGR